uniref:Uncharacterized protein n=1 Tax=viral metagenome TaxID=1070528 RepID=A0A6C0LJ48_9ZZZZ
MEMRLCTVAQNGTAVADKQEIDGTGDNEKLGSLHRCDIACSPSDIKFSCATYVKVTARLVCAWEQAEADHKRTRVAGSADVVTTVLIREVVVVELSAEVVVEGNTVSSDVECVNGHGLYGESRLLNLLTAKSESVDTLVCGSTNVDWVGTCGAVPIRPVLSG